LPLHLHKLQKSKAFKLGVYKKNAVSADWIAQARKSLYQGKPDRQQSLPPATSNYL
jgi:hypothetical protein